MSRGRGVEPPGLRGTSRDMVNAQAALDYLRSEDAQSVLRQKPWQIVFDMDDTLITNRALFKRSSEKLYKIYAQLDVRSRTEEELTLLHKSTDLELIKQFGYTPRRWRICAIQAAEIIAERNLDDVEQEQILAAAEIALGTGTVLPGVRDCLYIMKRAGLTMIMKTKGDRRMQLAKVEAHEFERLFNEIVIVKDKTPQSMLRLAKRFDLNRPVMIGDSIKSDILPALANNYEAILIQGRNTASMLGASPDDIPSKDMIEKINHVPKAATLPEAIIHLVHQELQRG